MAHWAKNRNMGNSPPKARHIPGERGTVALVQQFRRFAGRCIVLVGPFPEPSCCSTRNNRAVVRKDSRLEVNAMSKEHSMSRRASLKSLGAMGAAMVFGAARIGSAQSEVKPATKGDKDKQAVNVADVAVERMSRGHS